MVRTVFICPAQEMGDWQGGAVGFWPLMSRRLRGSEFGKPLVHVFDIAHALASGWPGHLKTAGCNKIADCHHADMVQKRP
jgi:hypothetical protein